MRKRETLQRGERVSLPDRSSGFRIIPQLDKYPTLVAFAATAPGKVVVTMTFFLVLYLILPRVAPIVAPILLLISLLPRYRYPLVLVRTLASALLNCRIASVSTRTGTVG